MFAAFSIKMNVLMSLYVVLLFVLLTPGILLTLPKGGSKLTVAVVHGLVFLVAYYFTSGIVLDAVSGEEGFNAVRHRGLWGSSGSSQRPWGSSGSSQRPWWTWRRRWWP